MQHKPHNWFYSATTVALCGLMFSTSVSANTNTQNQAKNNDTGLKTTQVKSQADDVKESKLTVKYVDNKGNELHKPASATNQSGADYKTTPPVIKGYITSTPKNAAGKFGDKDATVTYVYHKLGHYTVKSTDGQFNVKTYQLQNDPKDATKALPFKLDHKEGYQPVYDKDNLATNTELTAKDPTKDYNIEYQKDDQSNTDQNNNDQDEITEPDEDTNDNQNGNPSENNDANKPSNNDSNDDNSDSDSEAPDQGSKPSNSNSNNGSANKGQKGDKGDKGDTGKQGPQGKPGKDGKDGKNAPSSSNNNKDEQASKSDNNDTKPNDNNDNNGSVKTNKDGTVATDKNGKPYGTARRLGDYDPYDKQKSQYSDKNNGKGDQPNSKQTTAQENGKLPQTNADKQKNEAYAWIGGTLVIIAAGGAIVMTKKHETNKE